MKDSSIFLSVIIPAFNEASRINLPSVINSITDYLKSQKFPTELIVVNDGSTDATLKQLKEGQKKHRLKIISYSQNRGKGFAVKTGVLAAKGKYRLFLDMDLSVPIEELKKNLPYLKKNEVIIGSRKTKGSRLIVRQSKVRETLGKGFSFLSQLILGVKVRDFTCGFKCFSQNAAEKIFQKSLVNGWGFDSETLFLAKKFGFSIKEVPVIWKNDPKTRVKFPRDIFRSFFELVKIRLNDLAGLYRS
jgi:dolichyl-phosphate beta-glucosyltransferase